VIDAMLISVAWIAIAAVTPLGLRDSDPLVWWTFFAVTSTAYDALAVAWCGRTIGKAAVDLRVVSSRDQGGLPSPAEALARALVHTFSGFMGVGILIDFSLALFGGNNRALRDRVSKTLVLTTTAKNAKKVKAPFTPVVLDFTAPDGAGDEPDPMQRFYTRQAAVSYASRPRERERPGMSIAVMSALVIVSMVLVGIGFPRVVAERFFPSPKTSFDTEMQRARVSAGAKAKDAPDPCGIATLTAQMAHFGGGMVPAEGHPAEVVPASLKGSGFTRVRTEALPSRRATDGDQAIFLGEWVRGKNRVQISAWTFEDPDRAARWMQTETARICGDYEMSSIGSDSRSISSSARHGGLEREALVWIRGANAYLLIVDSPDAFASEITMPIVESTTGAP
jgi:uncharacterized RDD family membrane protein YckC